MNINISSIISYILKQLLSLKAELLRKQAEVNKAKTTHSISSSFPKKRVDKPAKSKQTPKEPKHIEEHEDTELLKKSRRILEAKTKLYNKMSANGGGGINSDDTCLVMFNHKKQSEISNGTQQSSYRDESSSDEDQSVDNNTADGDWVEYTDCLGRTRKCLKEDLEFFKKKDIDLADTVAARQDKVTSSAWFEDTKGSMPPPSALSASQQPTQPSAPVVSVQQKNFNDDDSSTIASKIDEMRSNWDKQEEENVNKDYVHYQDILFDGKTYKLI